MKTTRSTYGDANFSAMSGRLSCPNPARCNNWHWYHWLTKAWEWCSYPWLKLTATKLMSGHPSRVSRCRASSQRPQTNVCMLVSVCVCANRQSKANTEDSDNRALELYIWSGKRCAGRRRCGEVWERCGEGVGKVEEVLRGRGRRKETLRSWFVTVTQATKE